MRLLAGIGSALLAPGRALALAVLVLLALLRTVDTAFLEEARLRGFDLEQRLYHRVLEPAEVRVRVVAIDEKSLRRYGQWPWPRTLVARLVRKIAAGDPRVLGVDILFSESDRLSPGRLVESVPDIPLSIVHELSLLPANEAALAAAFQSVPTVLGLGGTHEPPPGARKPSPITPVRERGAYVRTFLFKYSSLVRDIPEIDAAALGRGTILGEPDSDGIVRRLPLMVVGERNLVPAFALEILRVAFGLHFIEIAASSDGIEGVQLEDLFLPTDSRGRAYPHFAAPHAENLISAADLLGGSYNPAQLKDDIVLLGVTGVGLVDTKETPIGLMPGTEIHAQLIESILTGDLLRRVPMLGRIEVGLVLAAGLLSIFVVPYSRPRIAGLALVGLVASFLGSGFAAFRFANLLVDTVYPAISAIVTFVIMLGAHLRAAEAARRRLAAELAGEQEAKARLEGELNAARAIQMGLLPRRFPGRPQRQDVEVYAVVEPAQKVGGDLYDVLMLDQRRLFFAIADVSGHGIPAALFMAMSMGVLRAATLRHSEALDQVFREANAEILAASDDLMREGTSMMFVTVFAGVLDLATGLIVYANAGHDSPFVRRRDATVLLLETEGGPPLGTVEHFPYAVGRLQLAPEELVLLYTDGVVEAENREGTAYTIARLEKVLASAPQGDAKSVVELVRSDVRQFIAEAGQADDLTVLAVRWLTPGPSAC
ncbi:MAG TPA: CHASE2 domain-containing protein [Alphaproteobacteria bacterium]|nr:CHASE2 domain-containing protein [Alphaproteobacteria bacterium]